MPPVDTKNVDVSSDLGDDLDTELDTEVKADEPKVEKAEAPKAEATRPKLSPMSIMEKHH